MARRPVPAGNGRAPLLGVLLVLVTAGLVTLHGLAVATGRDAAARTLTATLPALTDLDQALRVHGEAVRAAATDLGPVPVPGLPLTVAVPAEAAQAGGDHLRRAVVAAMTRAVYRSGSAAFRGDGSAGPSAAPLTRAWLLDHALNLLSAPSHERLAWWRTAVLAAATVLAVALAAVTGPWRMAVAVGSAMAAGALFAVLLTAVVWAAVVLLLSGTNDVTEAVIDRIAHDVAMTVVGTGLIVALAGTVLAAAGALPRRHGRGQDAAGGTAASRPAGLRAP
jgi:hypothetical protein